MGVRSILVVACLGALASPLAGEVEIRQSGDRVSLMAVSAPAAEILERLARQTGMRIVYDAQPPRQLITARLEQRTTAEAVLGIMEGLGLNYALVMDSAGTQVDQLLILGPVAAAPSTATAVPAPKHHAEPRPDPAELQVDLEEEERAMQEVDEEEEPAAQTTPAADGPAPTVVPAAPPPDYPSSAFTPRLPPPPTPAPVNPAAVGGATPTPQPSPNPR